LKTPRALATLGTSVEGIGKRDMDTPRWQ
jgi:hypothetical protein